jgi:hypothetical protein
VKTVILAGGLGTRLTEETVARPKPMVEIGGGPLSRRNGTRPDRSSCLDYNFYGCPRLMRLS